MRGTIAEFGKTTLICGIAHFLPVLLSRWLLNLKGGTRSCGCGEADSRLQIPVPWNSRDLAILVACRELFYLPVLIVRNRAGFFTGPPPPPPEECHR